MLDRMNIPRRLGFAFVVLNVVAAAVMIACGVILAMISSVTARNTESQAILANVLGLETALLRQNSQLRGFLVTADQSYLKSYYEGRDDYDRRGQRHHRKLRAGHQPAGAARLRDRQPLRAIPPGRGRHRRAQRLQRLRRARGGLSGSLGGA